MSNIKQVQIEAAVPWDWAGKLPVIEAAQFASAFLNDTDGLVIEQHQSGYEPNDNGGRTAMVLVQITGEEAVSYKWLERIVAALESLGTVTIAEALDVQWGGQSSDWEEIRRGEYEPAPSLVVMPYGQRGDGTWSYQVQAGGCEQRAESFSQGVTDGVQLAVGSAD